MSEVKTDDQVHDEIRDQIKAGEEAPAEFDSVEDEATALGWHKDGKNIHGETVSPERFIQEKPLYDTLEKHKKTFKRQDAMIIELQSDNKKISAASMKENERLLQQLTDAKKALLDKDFLDENDIKDVKDIDTKIDSTREDIASAPAETVSPYWGAFVEENSWASDDDDVRTLATREIVMRYKALNPDAGDKNLYDHLHKTIREKFPEKFETKKPQQKVGAVNKRVTDSSVKKTKVTLADLDPDEARIARNIMEQLGKSEEDYMKNYSTEGVVR